LNIFMVSAKILPAFTVVYSRKNMSEFKLICPKLSNVTLHQLDEKNYYCWKIIRYNYRKIIWWLCWCGKLLLCFLAPPEKECENNCGEANRKRFFDTIRSYGLV